MDNKSLRALNQETAAALGMEADHLKVTAGLGPERVDRLEQMMENMLDLGYGIRVFRGLTNADHLHVKKSEGDESVIEGDGSRSLQVLLGEACDELESKVRQRAADLKALGG
jgi:hypothetical protein